MGIISQSLKSSLVSYAGMAIGAFNLIWLYPKLLLPEEIGLIRVLQDFVIVFVGLTHVGTLSITDRFFPRFNDRQQRYYGFLSLTLAAMMAFFVLYCALIYLFRDDILAIYQKNSPQIQVYFDYTIPLAFFMLLQLALDAYARVHFQIVMSNFLKDVFLRVATSFLIIFYALKYINFEQLMTGIILIYASMCIVLIIYLGKLNILYLNIDLRQITKALIKEIGAFYAYVIVVGFHRMIISRIDILMMPALLSTRDVGVYSVALFIGAMIDIPCRAVNQISTPIIAQAWFDQNLQRLQEVYQKSAVNQFILGGLLFLGAWCNVDNIFRLMPKGDIYQSGKYVVFFIGLTRLIEMAAGASDVIILHSKHYRFNTILTMVLALFMFASNLVLIPRYHITGAAIASALSILIYTCIKFIFLWTQFKLYPFTRRSTWVVAAIISTWATINLIPVIDKVMIDIFIRSVAITIGFMSLVIFFKVSQDMNTLIYKTIFRY